MTFGRKIKNEDLGEKLQRIREKCMKNGVKGLKIEFYGF